MGETDTQQFNNKELKVDSVVGASIFFSHVAYYWLLPIAYFILFKQMAGRIFHKEKKEANLIFNIIFGLKKV